MFKFLKKLVLKQMIKQLIKTKGVKSVMEKIRLFLSGKKSYLTAVSIIVVALIEYSVSGDLTALINRVLEGIAVITIRAAVAK